MEARYFRPNSMTWWAGVFLIALGNVSVFVPDQVLVSAWGQAVAVFITGDPTAKTVFPPGALIGLGLGIIGLRDAQKRGE